MVALLECFAIYKIVHWFASVQNNSLIKDIFQRSAGHFMENVHINFSKLARNKGCCKTVEKCIYVIRFDNTRLPRTIINI